MSCRSVLVMNSGSIEDQSFTDPSDVTAGHIAAFTSNGDLVALDDGGDADTDQGLITDLDLFYVVGGDGEIVRRTAFMQASRFVDARKLAYSAPVKQVTTVTPITGTSGVASVKVTDMTTGYQPFPKVTFEARISEGDSATAIVTKLKNAANSIRRSPVVASGTNTLVLTAKDSGTSFSTSLQETQEGATITPTAVPSLGSGTYQQVRDTEWQNRAQMTGEYYSVNPILGDRTGEFTSTALNGLASPGTNYNIWIARYLNNQDDAINLSFKYHEVMFCLGTGVTGSLDAFLGL